MNTRAPAPVEAVPRLHRLALAALAPRVPADTAAPESDWLLHLGREVQGLGFEDWAGATPFEDRALFELGTRLVLAPAELIAVALGAEVEFDPMLGRVCAWLQAPVGGGRPTLGLIHSMAQALGVDEEGLVTIAQGAAQRCGLLRLDGESRPLPERSVQLPMPMALALRGRRRAHWPGVQALDDSSAPVPPSLLAEAGQHARCLLDGAPGLAVRSGHPREARLAAALVARGLQQTAMLIEGEVPGGLGPWLMLEGAMPVLALDLAPGEQQRLAAVPGYAGPCLVVTGLEGSVLDRDGDPLPGWTVPVPPAGERAAIWRGVLEANDADRLGRTHRYSAAHIAHLGRAARREAVLSGAARVELRHVERAARAGAAGELGTLAQLQTEDVPEDALVVPEDIRRALLALQQRCVLRETLAEGLGPAARTRYRPGVRALFVGPSGTGKSLAVGWLASRLGLPLYRVDLAAVSSKYIGETEKNLAQLFARAEHAEAVLMFDEADALFGKRTDVKDANDRFANAQTNYLLQRIESFDGIAILTSNSRARFDSAFTRRLDAIVEFPMPRPEDRRALWTAQLGQGATLRDADLNEIAATCDVAGGAIRNASLWANAAARSLGRQVTRKDLIAAVGDEYRKLGKLPPALASSSIADAGIRQE